MYAQAAWRVWRNWVGQLVAQKVLKAWVIVAAARIVVNLRLFNNKNNDQARATATSNRCTSINYGP